MTAGVRVAAGLGQADLPGVVAGADRLLFHAALYANFARNPAMAEALDTALARPAFQGLDVISLDVRAKTGWRDEFFAVLRHGLSPVELLSAFRESDAFLAALAGRHPGRVRHYASPSLPLAPILLVDAMIYAGHYLHGPVPAPEGLWLAVPADVAGLLRRAEAGIAPGPGDPTARAAYRYVRECVAARENARRVV